MKKAEIKVGGHYIAKVSGRIVTVRVDAIKEQWNHGPGPSIKHYYDVTNLKTGRKTTFRSAAKFRKEATTAVPTPPPSSISDERFALSTPFAGDPSAPVLEAPLVSDFGASYRGYN